MKLKRLTREENEFVKDVMFQYARAQWVSIRNGSPDLVDKDKALMSINICEQLGITARFFDKLKGFIYGKNVDKSTI